MEFFRRSPGQAEINSKKRTHQSGGKSGKTYAEIMAFLERTD